MKGLQCKSKTVHNSMRLNENSRLGFKVGQRIDGRKISHITMAGEVVFTGGSWTYDYELCKHNTDEDGHNICLLKSGENIHDRECGGAYRGCPVIDKISRRTS